jgi:protein SCO1/2
MRSVIPLMLLTLGLAACGASDAPWHGTDVSGHLPDLDFELVNDQGKGVTAKDFQERVTVLFFGFTSCPGPCPATLARLGVALERMGEAADDVQVLMVTVDPGRDSPEALAAYAERFGPWLHGLTGPEDELQRLRASYGIAAQRQLADADGDYDVQHSTAVVVFDAAGHCRLVISDTTDPDRVAQDLERLARESA